MALLNFVRVEFSSKIVEQAVAAFSSLPGVGKKTALRYVMHLIKQNNEDVNQISSLISKLKTDLKFCVKCHNISESEQCDICMNPVRDNATICVVQDYRDVMAIENTGLFKGVYHVLGGLISPMDGVGPGNLNIETLASKISAGGVNEVILALSGTMEGETTSFYVYRKLSPHNITLSVIARGIAVGDELEYADEVTLARSITNRVPFNTFLTAK